jgi:putative hydrolase of the HAD superfamily
MPRAVLFDLDNTLIDRDAAARRFVEARAPEHAAGILEQDASGYGDLETFCVWVAERTHRLGATAAEVRESWLSGVPAHTEPDARAVDLVARVKARYAVAVVTNGGGRTQREKLARSHLDELFEEVLVSAEVGAHKPDARIFERALDAVGVPAADALFVGDDPERDMEGARRAGLRTCWVARGRAWPSQLPAPDHVVQHVAELGEVLGC